jgi:flagellar biogenesis protein FliO
VAILAAVAVLCAAAAAADEKALPAKTPAAREQAGKPAEPAAAEVSEEKKTPAEIIPKTSFADEKGRIIGWKRKADTAERGKNPAQARSLFGLITSLVLWVGLISIIIIGGFCLIRKFFPGTRRLFGSRLVRILGRSHLSPKHSVYLLKVGERVLVLGVSGDRINPLAEINDEREVALMAAEGQPAPSEGPRLSFKKLFGRGKEVLASQEPPPGELDEAREEIKRIRRMVSSWKERYEPPAAAAGEGS